MRTRDCTGLLPGRGPLPHRVRVPAPHSSRKDHKRHGFGSTLSPDEWRISTLRVAIPHQPAYRLIGAVESPTL
jgi:hypothetical protein